MKPALLVLAAAILALLAYIRLAPSDAARWHTDPATAPDPGPAGVLVTPGTYVSAETPTSLLERFDAVARKHSAVRLAGSVNEGHITYVVRSKWFGFPDYITIRTIPAGTGGSTFSILSRLRFGRSDLGVNRARLNAWLEELQLRPS
ncbi:MAG: DUF1499 domain-containing protein [Beijerinckiaceae bacterium]